MNKLKEKFMRFMQGRNGVDQLSQFLNIVVLVLIVLTLFIKWEPLYWLSIALLVYMYFRIFSKNIPKRSVENQKFCNLRYDLAIKKNNLKKQWEQRKIYRFFRCPMCKQKVRVPKGRGKICITCPKCRQEFVRRSQHGGYMFGYINVNKKELSEEKQKIYQAYYCGLCQTLREHCGKKGQVLLSYDMTFLELLLTGLYEPIHFEYEFTCMVHPTKKQLAYENEVSDYCAAINVMLAYHNMVDDWKDEKKFSKKHAANVIHKDYEKFAEKYPRQVQAIENYMKELAEFEKKEETNIDLVAGLTGQMLGEVFAWKEDEWYQELKTLGFYMGKFIYLMDAYEDVDKDEKKNTYNPLRNLKKDNPKDFETLTRLMMTSMMSECAKSFERLPIILHADILRNILYSGVWTKYEYIQLKKKKRTK